MVYVFFQKGRLHKVISTCLAIFKVRRIFLFYFFQSEKRRLLLDFISSSNIIKKKYNTYLCYFISYHSEYQFRLILLNVVRNVNSVFNFTTVNVVIFARSIFSRFCRFQYSRDLIFSIIEFFCIYH